VKKQTSVLTFRWRNTDGALKVMVKRLKTHLMDKVAYLYHELPQTNKVNDDLHTVSKRVEVVLHDLGALGRTLFLPKIELREAPRDLATYLGLWHSTPKPKLHDCWAEKVESFEWLDDHCLPDFAQRLEHFPSPPKCSPFTSLVLRILLS